jgi:acyl dehydratase
LHVDEVAVARSPFGGVIASGGYIISFWYRSLIDVYNTPTATWALLVGLEWNVRFRAPLRPADTLRAHVTVREKRPWITPDRGLVQLYSEILKQRSEVVCTVEAKVLLATRPGNAARSP